MELRALEYFVAVAEERHFTRAAARVHVSQSGLSAAIRSLEAELHAELFDRTTRRVQLTAAGAALLPEARRALAAARAGAEAVDAVQGLERGSVAIGVMQQTVLVSLPAILADYHRRYPNIELRLRQASSAELHRLLIDGALDLAIASPPQTLDERLITVDLLRTPLVLVCRADDPLAQRRHVSIRHLQGRNLIGHPTGWALRDLGDQAIQRSGLHLETNLEVNDIATLLDLVAAGLGVTLTAAAIAEQRPEFGQVPLAGPPINWTISAVAPAPEPTNNAAQVLWRRLTAAGTQISDPAGRNVGAQRSRAAERRPR